MTASEIVGESLLLVANRIDENLRFDGGSVMALQQRCV
jgi:hypothetical protein